MLCALSLLTWKVCCKQCADVLILCLGLQYKDRVDYRLIKPAVDWRKAGVQDATNKAAVASQ